MDLLIVWLITAFSLLVVAWLPTGVEIEGFGKALLAALVFGVLNALLKPILQILALPFNILTLGLFSFVVNAIIFGLAAYFVTGFNLKNGFISALLGSIALSLVSRFLEFIILRGS